MKKIINPCRTKDGNVFCEITFEGGKLSITGVVGPKANGDARGGCGQINMSFAESYPAPTFNTGWNAEMFARFLATWDKWHLNNMRAGCEHQRAAWDPSAPVTVTSYTWGPAFYAMRKQIEDATATAEEYQTYQTMKARVYAVTIGIGLDQPKHETPEIGELHALGMVKVEKTETKTAGWVSTSEHPDGLLSKPCPVCGYKYGTAWLKEDVPPEVLSFLGSLPDSTITPAWV